MGARGPVPRHSSERRRRNKDSKVETVKVAEVLPAIPPHVVAPAVKSTWHPIAKEWYESLRASGQAAFYEPSDWAAARYVAEAMSINLRQQKKFSAVLFASVLSAMSDLLTTEAARRRVRLEIERPNPDEGAKPGVTAIADYRKRLAAK